MKKRLSSNHFNNLGFWGFGVLGFWGNIKSLISEFNYPRFGPGQMWELMAEAISANGGEIRMNAPVTKLMTENGKVIDVVAGGETLTPSHVISSLPLRTTVGIAEPEAPVAVRDAARGLRYREFLTVLLVMAGEDLFPDNWIYIHQPGVRCCASRTSSPGVPGWCPKVRPTPRRHGVLLLRGRRAVEHGRRRARGDGRPGDREAQARQGRERQVRLRRARAQGVPDLRRRVRRAGPTIRGWLESESRT